MPHRAWFNLQSIAIKYLSILQVLLTPFLSISYAHVHTFIFVDTPHYSLIYLLFFFLPSCVLWYFVSSVFLIQSIISPLKLFSSQLNFNLMGSRVDTQTSVQIRILVYCMIGTGYVRAIRFMWIFSFGLIPSTQLEIVAHAAKYSKWVWGDKQLPRRCEEGNARTNVTLRCRWRWMRYLSGWMIGWMQRKWTYLEWRHYKVDERVTTKRSMRT